MRVNDVFVERINEGLYGVRIPLSGGGWVDPCQRREEKPCKFISDLKTVGITWDEQSPMIMFESRDIAIRAVSAVQDLAKSCCGASSTPEKY